MNKKIKYLIKDILTKLKPFTKVKVDGIELIGRWQDFGFLKALRKGEREAFMFDLFMSAIKPGMVVVDVGAHLGHYALTAAKKVGATGKVVGFEADPNTFQCLKKSIAINQMESHTTAYNMALADKRGKVSFYRDVYQPDFSSMHAQRADAVIDKVEIDAISLDEFISQHPGIKRVDVLKIDIEGAESAALRGAAASIKEFKPLLFIESNPEALAQLGDSPEGLIDQIEALGFKVSIIDEDLKALVPVSEKALKSVCNLYCQM